MLAAARWVPTPRWPRAKPLRALSHPAPSTIPGKHENIPISQIHREMMEQSHMHEVTRLSCRPPLGR